MKLQYFLKTGLMECQSQMTQLEKLLVVSDERLTKITGTHLLHYAVCFVLHLTLGADLGHCQLEEQQVSAHQKTGTPFSQPCLCPFKEAHSPWPFYIQLQSAPSLSASSWRANDESSWLMKYSEWNRRVEKLAHSEKGASNRYGKGFGLAYRKIYFSWNGCFSHISVYFFLHRALFLHQLKKILFHFPWLKVMYGKGRVKLNVKNMFLSGLKENPPVKDLDKQNLIQGQNGHLCWME